MWKDILKEEDEDSPEFRQRNYGRKRPKRGKRAPPKSQPERRAAYFRGEDEGDDYTYNFREGMGFERRDFTDYRGSGTEEMPSTDLANWFATVNDSFEELFNQLAGGIEGEGNLPDIGPLGGMPYKYKEDTGAFKKFKESSMLFAKNLVESMLESYIDTIVKLEDYDDDEKSTQGIMNSKGYQETLQGGLKASTEIISSVMDTAFLSIQSQEDMDNYLGTEVEEEDFDVEYLMNPADGEEINKYWQVTGQSLGKDIENILNNTIEELFSEPSLNIDFDNDGDKENVNSRELTAAIKLGAMAFFDGRPSPVSGEVERESGIELLKIINGNTIKHFIILYMPRLKRLEASQTEEGEVDYEDRPEIEFDEDTDAYGDRFRDEFKSFDEVNQSWQSILKIGGSGAIGMTSMAGFTPTMHNITYGGSCCDECAEKKTKPCGCGN